MEMKAFTILFLFLSLCALNTAKPNIHSLDTEQNSLDDEIIDDKTSLDKPKEDNDGFFWYPSSEEDKYKMPPVETDDIIPDIIPERMKIPPYKPRLHEQIKTPIRSYPYTDILEEQEKEVPFGEDFYLRNVLNPPHDFTSGNTQNAKFPLHLNVEDSIIESPGKFKESDIKMTPVPKPLKSNELTTETVEELKDVSEETPILINKPIINPHPLLNEEKIIRPSDYFLIRATSLPESSSTSSHFTTRKVETIPVRLETPLPKEAKLKENVPQQHQNLIVEQEKNKSQSTKKPEQEQKALDLKDNESSYLDLLLKAIKLTLKEAQKISDKEQVIKNVKYQTHQASCRKRSHHLSNKSDNNTEIDKQQEDKVNPTFIDKISMYIVNVVLPEKRVHKKNITLTENHISESVNISPTTSAPKPIQTQSTTKTINPTTSAPKTSQIISTTHTINPTTSAPKTSQIISTTHTINPTTSAPKTSQIISTTHTINPTTSAPKTSQIISTTHTINPTTSAPKTSHIISTTQTINPTTSTPKPSQINHKVTSVTSNKKEDISIKLSSLKSFPVEAKQVQNRFYSNDRKLISKLNSKYEILPRWYSSLKDPMNSIIRNPWLLRKNDFVLPRNRISLLNKFPEAYGLPYVNPELLSLNFRENIIPADNYLNLIQPKSLRQVSKNFPYLTGIPNNLRRYADLENIFNRPNIKKIGKENELFLFRSPFSKNIELSYKNEEKPIIGKKKLNIDAAKKIVPAIIETEEIIINKNLNPSPDSNKNVEQPNTEGTKTKDCSTSKPKSSSATTIDKTEPQANSNNVLNNNSDQIKSPTPDKKLSHSKENDNKNKYITSKDIQKELLNLPSLYNNYLRNKVIREKVRNEPINFNDMLGLFPPFLF